MTQEDPDISIIIPVYNADALIQRCIDSILSQSNQIKTEVIFVDDGSTDNSVDIINSYNNTSFKIIRQENGGPAKARNTGLRIARGKFLAYIDADDYWFPSFLQTTMHFLEDNSDVVAVSVGQKHIRGMKNSVVPKCIKEYDKPIILENFYWFWSRHHHVCTGSVLLRMDIAKTIGGQREDLRACEDWEFWLMVATYGRWGFIPEVLFTSDGDDVTKKKGWVKKMKKRRESLPPMFDFEKRLLTRLTPPFPDGYEEAIGYIACRVIRGHILGHKWDLARDETKYYHHVFPTDEISGKIFHCCSKNKLGWYLMTILLHIKDNIRNLVYKIR